MKMNTYSFGEGVHFASFVGTPYESCLNVGKSIITLVTQLRCMDNYSQILLT